MSTISTGAVLSPGLMEFFQGDAWMCQSSLLRSRVVILLFPMFSLLGILKSTMLLPTLPTLHHTFTHPPVSSLFISKRYSRAPPWLAPWLQLGSCHQCTPEIFWIACALLFCLSGRYQGGWSLPEGPVLLGIRRFYSVCRSHLICFFFLIWNTCAGHHHLPSPSVLLQSFHLHVYETVVKKFFCPTWSGGSFHFLITLDPQRKSHGCQSHGQQKLCWPRSFWSAQTVQVGVDVQDLFSPQALLLHWQDLRENYMVPHTTDPHPQSHVIMFNGIHGSPEHVVDAHVEEQQWGKVWGPKKPQQPLQNVLDMRLGKQQSSPDCRQPLQQSLPPLSLTVSSEWCCGTQVSCFGCLVENRS